MTSDELETPNHIPLELIPTGPNSADHTLFMSALKSCTGDHTIPRTDHVMPAPAAHVLDENTSPDPQPTPTMVSLYIFYDVRVNMILSSTRLQDHQNVMMAHCVLVY